MDQLGGDDGRGEPERGESLEIERVSLSSHRLRVRFAVVASAVLVAIAAVKPWGTAAPPGPPVPPLPEVALGTAGSPVRGTPTSEALAPPPCPIDGGWFVVDDDRLGPYQTRTWTVADVTIRATSPSDQAIPFTRIVTSDVRQLGFCSPPRGSGSTGWTGTLWIEAASATGTNRWQRAAQYSADGRLSQLLAAADGPPISEHASPTGFGATWPPGRYVLEIRPAGRTGSLWLGVDFEATPPALPG